MYESLRRVATRKALAAGLAAIVATAGIGVAVAAPSNSSSDQDAAEVAAVAMSRSSLALGVPEAENPATEAPEQGAQDDESTDNGEGDAVDVETGSTQDGQAGVNPTASSRVSTPTSLPAADVSAVLDQDQDDVGDPGDVAEGAEELASGVIARIQACVGDVFGDLEDFDFGEGFDLGGFGGTGGGTSGGGFNFGGSGDLGQSFTTDVVDDVLPCVAGLVEDALRCVSGLVEEIFDAVMSMDIDQMLGLVDVVVDELVSCVANAD